MQIKAMEKKKAPRMLETTLVEPHMAPAQEQVTHLKEGEGMSPRLKQERDT